MPWRVLHLITDLDPGGAELALCRLIETLDPARLQSRVVTLTEGGALKARLQKIGIQTESVHMRHRMIGIGTIRRLARVLRDTRPDIVQTWLYHADLVGILCRMLAPSAALAWNVRCSYLDVSDYAWQSAVTRFALAHLSRVPDAVVVNSEAGRRFHEQLGYRPRRWVLIPNGIDLDTFCPDPEAANRLKGQIGVPRDATIIGMVARYDPIKDHATLLEAAARLVERRGNVGFVLVGRSINYDNRPLADLISRHNLTAHVTLLGERDDVPAILAGLDIAVLSSRGEGFPNVVAEAMACGVPAVATDVGDARSIVGETGRIVSPRSPEHLAAALGELIDAGPSARRALGHTARARIAERFALPRLAEAYAQLYEELAACRHMP